MRRGNGIAVASSTEATAVGIGRSWDEEDDDRREVLVGFDGVRDRTSRNTGVREPRLVGIPTGIVLVDPRGSTS